MPDWKPLRVSTEGTGNRGPEARIEKRGRFWRLVYIVHGAMRYGPDGHGWYVFGDKRADRKAEKVLAAYMKDSKPEVRVVRGRHD